MLNVGVLAFKLILYSICYKIHESPVLVLINVVNFRKRYLLVACTDFVMGL